MGSPAMDSVQALADDVRELRAELRDVRTDLDALAQRRAELKGLVEDVRRSYNDHIMQLHATHHASAQALRHLRSPN